MRCESSGCTRATNPWRFQHQHQGRHRDAWRVYVQWVSRNWTHCNRDRCIQVSGRSGLSFSAWSKSSLRLSRNEKSMFRPKLIRLNVGRVSKSDAEKKKPTEHWTCSVGISDGKFTRSLSEPAWILNLWRSGRPMRDESENVWHFGLSLSDTLKGLSVSSFQGFWQLPLGRAVGDSHGKILRICWWVLWEQICNEIWNSPWLNRLILEP